MPVKYRRYFESVVPFVVEQKWLFGIFGVILIMGLGVVILSFGDDTRRQGLRNDGFNQTSPQNSSQIDPRSVQVPVGAPEPTDVPLTTRFIYFIQSTLGQEENLNQNGAQSGSGGRGLKTGNNGQTSSVENASNDTTGQTGGAGNAGGSSSGGQGGSQGGQGASGPTPTPPTDIEIVFVNENGEFWTYVPPAVPPIDVNWLRYTNHQDHYSIEFPADWLVVTSYYNGHEGITLYRPGASGSIDKPSIAFVGWKANYLSSTAKYSGQIVLKGTPGTLYTNGPLGPSSVAAVFEYPNGFFALGSSISDPVFIYVFDHMLRSLEFNVE
jgi:hypothetical protein